MLQLVHMQSSDKYHSSPGNPIHRHRTKWHGDPEFKTTTNPKKVTCKTCLRMLSKPSQK